TAQPIAAVDSFEGGTWNQEGTILYGSAAGPLFRVAAAGGTPAAVTTLDAAKAELSHRWPAFMPDGRHYVFCVSPSNRIRFASLDGTPARDVIAADARPVFSPAGYLLYGAQGLLQARRFNPTRGEFLGEAVTIAENVRMAVQNARATYSVSDNAIL